MGIIPLQSELETKRNLLEIFLKNDARKVDGTAPIYASIVLPDLPTLNEEKINELLAEKLYAQDASALDPPASRRKPDQIMRMGAQIRRAMSVYACSESEAARRVFKNSEWRRRVSRSSFETMYRQSKRVVRNLQLARNSGDKRNTAFQRLYAAADGKALLRKLQDHSCAYAIAQALGNGKTMRFHDRKICSILDSDDPTISVFILAFATTPLESFYDRLDGLFGELEKNEKASEIERLTAVLIACGLLPGGKSGFFQK